MVHEAVHGVAHGVVHGLGVGGCGFPCGSLEVPFPHPLRSYYLLTVWGQQNSCCGVWADLQGPGGLRGVEVVGG